MDENTSLKVLAGLEQSGLNISYVLVDDEGTAVTQWQRRKQEGSSGEREPFRRRKLRRARVSARRITRTNRAVNYTKVAWFAR